MVTPQSSRDRTGASGKMENTRLWQSYARCRLGLEESDALECELKRNAEEGHVHAAFGIQPGHSSTVTCPRRAQELSPQGAKVKGRAGVLQPLPIPHPQERNSAPASSPGRARLYFPEAVTWEPRGRVASAINQVFFFPWSFGY